MITTPKRLLPILGIVTSILTTTLLSGCETNNNDSQTNSLNKYSVVYMDYFDTVSTIIGYTETEDEFNETASFIKDELERYDSLYDAYNSMTKDHTMYYVNKYASEGPVKVDKDLFELFKQGKEIYTFTNGMTNFAMGSVYSIWHDHREDANYDPSTASVPELSELKEAAKHCNIDDVILDEANLTVYYADSKLKCDIGAFAKGYAIERISQDLISKGITGFSLNIGGNVRTIGPKPNNEKWAVAIQNPDLKAETNYSEIISISDMALTTSGSYQRYFYVDGVRYHHIINPDTLFPENTFLSVSILNTDAGMGDALSTALFNMSLEDGQKLIESLDGTEAMWILADETKVYSSGFKKYIK